MKKKAPKSAFLIPRLLLGLALCSSAAGLAVFALYPPIPEPEELAKFMPVFGAKGKARNEARELGRMEQFWNDRLTYPTGRFSPNWVRQAAEQHAKMPTGVPAGSFERLKNPAPNGLKGLYAPHPLALSTSGWTSLGPSPLGMTGCSSCYDYTKTQARVNTIVVDPTTTTPGSITAYIGSVNGGVWKTTNCSTTLSTWTSLTDDVVVSTTAIDTLALDPNNHNTIYAGTGDLNYGSFSMGSQGILKSTDGGAHWTVLGASVFGPVYTQPTGNYPQYNAVGKVRVDPNNSNNVVAGTKKGLYFSYDAGNNWTGPCLTNSFTTQRQDITGLELTNMGGGVTRILAAVGTRGFPTYVQYDLGANGANGIYSGNMQASGCPSFNSIASNANGFVYGSAVSGSPYSTGANMNAGSGNPCNYPISGGTATFCGGATGGTVNNLGRIDLAVAPSNPDVIYAQVGSIAWNSASGCGSTTGCQLGVWSTSNGGTTWSFMTGSAGGSLTACAGSAGGGDYPQNWYDQGMAVDPNNPDRVFIDTFDTWFATRTGTSHFDLTCGYNGTGASNHVVHVDHHALAFVPGSSSILLEGSDGGIFATTNANTTTSSVRPTWINMDTNLNTFEFYSGDISGNFANDPAPMAAGGAQDNCAESVTFSGSPTGPVQWQAGLGGDGFSGHIDPMGIGPSQAVGTITVSAAGTAGQQFTIGTQTFTWAATRTVAGTVAVGASATAAATNLRIAVNTDISAQVTAAGGGSSIPVTATTPGAGGNSIVFVNVNSANLTFNGSGVLGGTTQGGIPGSLRVWEGNNSGGLSRCVSNCSSGGATWSSRQGAWTGDTQSFVLPLDLFHGGIPGGDDCQAAGPTTGCGHLLAATTRVFETITGATATNTWVVTNNPTTQNLTKNTLGNRSYINQVKYSPKYQSVAVVGTNDGNVAIGFNLGSGVAASGTWVDVTGANAVLPNRPILGVALDPSVSAASLPVGYAAVGGFNANTPATTGHIFQVTCSTANCGSSTWVDKTGNLPDIPANCVIVNPNYPQQVFLGTDFGVYFTNDVTQAPPTWYRFDSGMPHVMIWDMAIDRGATTLSAWTRGRGAFVYPLTAANISTPAPILQSAVSRMTHGAAGPFDLSLPTNGRGIEPRTDGTGNYQIILTFDQPITAGGATVTSGTGSVGSSSANGNTLTVNLTAVTDQQTMSITTNSVANSGTFTAAPFTLNVGFLAGDVNSDGVVNVDDTIVTRSHAGVTLDNTNFQDDVNVDGLVNVGDTVIVRNKSGDFLP